MRLREGTVVAVTGLPGIGKSTLADLTARETGAPSFAGDWLPGALAPPSADRRGPADPARLDTAIAVLGLVRAGHPRPAAPLGAGLVAAGRHFGFRLPELFGGTAAAAGEPVLAYPAACRPQSWSAAGVVGLLTAALGLTADVPARTLRIEPDAAFAGWFPLAVSGLRVGGERLDVEVDAAGEVQASTAADVTLHYGRGW